MHSKEHRYLMSTIQEYIDKGYDSLTDLYTCRPSELVNTLSKRGTFSHLRPDVHRWFELTTEAVSVVTSDLEFIGYLKGRMLEAQLEWENNDTSETVSKFLYFYNYLIDVISTKLLDEKYLYTDKYLSVNWQDDIERYSKQDMEAVASLFGDNLEMYYDKRNEKWVACTPSGDLVSIYDKQEGESIV